MDFVSHPHLRGRRQRRLRLRLLLGRGGRRLGPGVGAASPLPQQGERHSSQPAGVEPRQRRLPPPQPLLLVHDALDLAEQLVVPAGQSGEGKAQRCQIRDGLMG